ncbi:MAG: WYL domain-containing protein [Clostridia bacterium]|nr:WYL domain-containing protein [Clostridia bacterium]
MARSPNQKLKILYLMQMLLEETDESHPLPMEQILANLAANGICAERKSIYDDIESLRLYGLDIRMTKSRPSGYYVLSRRFELPELKLLVDSVQESQFITEKKTLQLIKKLESLCSRHEAYKMRRQVLVSGRIKHMNESIYYSVDAIHTGIAEDKKIRFRYFEYTPNKQKAYRHDGAYYCVSPFALTWNNENYYLIGYDGEAACIKHYRVDRMERISVTEEAREGKDAFSSHDMSVYTRRTFSMFGGEETRVDMEFENHLVGVVMDRFGKDAPLVKTDDTHFSVSAEVAVSPQFYAWIFGLGTGARITGPAQVVDGMKQMLKNVGGAYED